MPVSIGSTRCPGAGPAPFFACVRCALAVLFVIGGSLAPVVGTVSLGRRDSHADQGAVATQFSNSTGTGTSPSSTWEWAWRGWVSVLGPRSAPGCPWRGLSYPYRTAIRTFLGEDSSHTKSFGV